MLYQKDSNNVEESIAMKEIIGDIWKVATDEDWIVIPTNGDIDRKGEAVMGAGMALYCKENFPFLPRELGERLKTFGNHLQVFFDIGLITFPTKRHWQDDSTLELIELSCTELYYLIQFGIKHLGNPFKRILIPRVGCGNGKLQWSEVKKILNSHFNGEPRIVIVATRKDADEDTRRNQQRRTNFLGEPIEGNQDEGRNDNKFLSIVPQSESGLFQQTRGKRRTTR